MKEERTHNINLKELDNSEIEIEASLPWEDVEAHRKAVVERYSENLKLDGFRKGRIPENIVIQNIGEHNIISDMAEKALQNAYPIIVRENNLNVIGAPRISVTKLAKDNPLEFKITTAVMPEVKLPDYKTVAREVNSTKEEIKVEDKEIEDAIKHIREQWTRSEKVQKMVKDDGMKMEDIDPRTIEIKDEELPKLDNEFVKKLGAFENVEDFKIKLRKNMLHEKTLQAKEKKRAKILEKIVIKTEVSIPEVVIEGELNRMVSQFKGDVARAGMEFDKYLEQTGKKEEDLRKEWRQDAEKYAKNQMVMNKIAIEENLVPEKKLVDEEVEKIIKNYKDADRNRAKTYVETMITNDMIFKFLEKQK